MNWRGLFNFGKCLRTSRPHPPFMRRQVYVSSFIVVQEPNVSVQCILINDAKRGLPPDETLIAIILN